MNICTTNTVGDMSEEHLLMTSGMNACINGTMPGFFASGWCAALDSDE